MALIKYVGKKARKTDTVAGSGIIWNGPGDVQQVADKFVADLLKHTDSWVLADRKERVPEPEAPDATNEPAQARQENVEEDASRPPLVNLDSMGKQDLADYAQRYFGHQFHHRTSEDKMRQTIVGLMNRG